jgi:hypothetical protein
VDLSANLAVEGHEDDEGDAVHRDQVHPVDVDGDVQWVLKYFSQIFP